MVCMNNCTRWCVILSSPEGMSPVGTSCRYIGELFRLYEPRTPNEQIRLHAWAPSCSFYYPTSRWWIFFSFKLLHKLADRRKESDDRHTTADVPRANFRVPLSVAKTAGNGEQNYYAMMTGFSCASTSQNDPCWREFTPYHFAWSTNMNRAVICQLRQGKWHTFAMRI